MDDDGVTVRRYAASDHAAVLALAPELTVGVAAFRPAAGVAQAARAWLDDALAGAERADHAVFVADLDGTVVGVLGVGEKRHFAGDRDAYIGELAVDPALRRRGVARALVEAAQDWATDRGLAHLTLDTGAANDGALAFYRSLGFVTEQVTLSRPVT